VPRSNPRHVLSESFDFPSGEKQLKPRHCANPWTPWRLRYRVDVVVTPMDSRRMAYGP